MAQILRVGRVNNNSAGFCRDMLQLFEAFNKRGLSLNDFIYVFKINFVDKHYNFRHFLMEKEALYSLVKNYLSENFNLYGTHV